MVIRIPGFLEYDDDDLTPGKKKEGGLHQNLYNGDGDLKGHARFIPGEEQDPDPVVVGQSRNVHGKKRNVHDTKQERRRVREQRRHRVQDEVADFLAEIMRDAVKELVVEATPHAKRLWNEKALPVIEARRAEATEDAKLWWREQALPTIGARLARNATRKAAAKQPIVVEATIVDSGQEPESGPIEERGDQ